ncbi:hypothetical protein [Nocardia sp. BMG51109]|uniref:hypothetical protein n=1 Tax=Nocardia sp. BMG51109 TaxID=1056816 RepID=UPI000463CB73|nr:hypothetical protein [Nocardia sp. BMG51109]
MPADNDPIPLDARRRRARPAHAPESEPEQLTFDADMIDYWRKIARSLPPLDRDQLSAIGAIIQRIDERRAATNDDDGPHERPQAA